MRTGIAALLLTLSSVSGTLPAGAKPAVAPSTLSIGDLDILAHVASDGGKPRFLRWDVVKSRHADRGLNVSEALPIADFTCTVKGTTIDDCRSAVPRRTWERLYRPLLRRIHLSASEIDAAGAPPKTIAVSVTRYVDPCTELRCSITPPPPPPPPGDAG